MNNKKELVGFILTIFLFAIYFIFEKWNRKEHLKETVKTWAVVTHKTVHKTYYTFNLFFYSENKKVNVKGLVVDYSCFNERSIGDTIEIIHSTSNPEIIELRTCFKEN